MALSTFLCQFPACCFLSYIQEFFIETFLNRQLLMGSLLLNMTMIQHQNLICVPYGLQTVSNHDNGLVVGQRFNGCLQKIFIFRIDAGSCLIENDDRCIL